MGLHPNGFQDRPVMTTSVPLVIQNARLILPVKTHIVKQSQTPLVAEIEVRSNTTAVTIVNLAIA